MGMLVKRILLTRQSIVVFKLGVSLHKTGATLLLRYHTIGVNGSGYRTILGKACLNILSEVQPQPNRGNVRRSNQRTITP